MAIEYIGRNSGAISPPSNQRVIGLAINSPMLGAHMMPTNTAVPAATHTYKKVVNGSLFSVFTPRKTQNPTAMTVTVHLNASAPGSADCFKRLTTNQQISAT